MEAEALTKTENERLVPGAIEESVTEPDGALRHWPVSGLVRQSLSPTGKPFGASAETVMDDCAVVLWLLAATTKADSPPTGTVTMPFPETVAVATLIGDT